MKINSLFQLKLNYIIFLIFINVTCIAIDLSSQRHLTNGDYGTHMTALIAAAMHTQGPILELGCGDYSTPLLHSICSATERKLISAESDLSWLSFFMDLRCAWHTFISVPVRDANNQTIHLWDTIDPEEHYGMVFIDHAPALRRIEDIKRLREKTDVFVIHDTEDPRYNYESILPTFKYQYVDSRYAITTTVVSDTIDVSKFFQSTCITNDKLNSKNYGQIEEIFTDIFIHNKWSSWETRSGRGSEIAVTRPICHGISALIKMMNITSMVDAGCGDFNWMRLMDLGSCQYIGLDIVKALIEQNTHLHASLTRNFHHHNIIEEPIKSVDLILCRDVSTHLTNADIIEMLKNFKRSGSKYLLITTNISIMENSDISHNGDWRLLNLEKAPFNFPKPLTLIQENVPFECERGKHLGLWRLEDIKIS